MEVVAISPYNPILSTTGVYCDADAGGNWIVWLTCQAEITGTISNYHIR